MTITIPTSELVGLISDALVFAPVDKDSSLFGIQVAWDGEHLTAAGYDTLSGAYVRWSFENDDDSDDPDVPPWGPDEDEPRSWSAFLAFPDAKEIVKTFRLARKFLRTPVYLDMRLGPLITPEDDDRGAAPRLYVSRHRHPWCTAHTMTIQTLADVKFPDIREICRVALEGAPDGMPNSVMVFNAARLAQFGMVRQDGNAAIKYLGDTDRPTVINVGSRVEGFVFPAGAAKAADTARRAYA